MRISVVVATYRSGAYLREQLTSILSQDRPVDEIIVTDDCSGDDTLTVVYELLENRPDAIVLANSTNVGITENYRRGLEAVTGDVVFLSDHDDLWHRQKTRLVAAHFEKNPDLLLSFSNGRLIDGQGSPLPGTLWERVGFGLDLQAAMDNGHAIDVLAKKTVVTGAATALSPKLLELALPFPTSGWHDSWLALVAAASGNGSRICREPTALIDYRLHGNNAAGVPDGSLSARWAYRHHGVGDTSMELGQWRELDKRLAALQSPASTSQVVAAKLRHLQGRAQLPPTRFRRIPGVFQEWRDHGYDRFADGYRTAASDLIRPA